MARLVINFSCNWHARDFIFNISLDWGLMNWQLELEITGDTLRLFHGKGTMVGVLEA